MPRVVETVDGAWRKAVVVDDWGVLGYYLRAVKSDAGTWGHAEQDKAQQLKPKERIAVRWPDGTETHGLIVGRLHTRIVSDMGHTYEAKSTRLVVQANLRGLLTDVPLETLWIRRL